MTNAAKQKQRIQFPALDTLSRDAITSVSRTFDWDREDALVFRDPGRGEFRCWQAVRCDGCNEHLVFENFGGGMKHRDHDPNSSCDGDVPGADGPATPYYYPFALGASAPNPASIARLIIETPLCFVQVGDEYGLALSTGFSDMAWDICLAFMLAGYLPPSHLARGLSAIAEIHTPTRAWVAAGCRKSLSVHMAWLRQGIQHVRNAVHQGKKYSQQMAAKHEEQS